MTSLNQMGLVSRYGVDIKDAWANGITTYLGLAIPDFPNAFIINGPYGKQRLSLLTQSVAIWYDADVSETAPSTLSNGPTLIETQADLIAQIIAKAELEKLKVVETTIEAALEWKHSIEKTTKQTLLAQTESWWTNSNVKGKKPEFLTYIKGVKSYEDICENKIANWEGFITHASHDNTAAEDVMEKRATTLAPTLEIS